MIATKPQPPARRKLFAFRAEKQLADFLDSRQNKSAAICEAITRTKAYREWAKAQQDRN